MTPLHASSLFAAVLLLAPPASPPTDPTIQHLEMAGVKLQGRDPCQGTGLCCALLPVCQPSDVDYITFPRHWVDLTNVAMLGHFPNLKCVGCVRTVSKAEFDTLLKTVSPTTSITCRVRLENGTATRAWRIDPRIQRRIRHATDINGDGVVNEDDLVSTQGLP